jgi:hypothetical protein
MAHLADLPFFVLKGARAPRTLLVTNPDDADVLLIQTGGALHFKIPEWVAGCCYESCTGNTIMLSSPPLQAPFDVQIVHQVSITFAGGTPMAAADVLEIQGKGSGQVKPRMDGGVLTFNLKRLPNAWTRRFLVKWSTSGTVSAQGARIIQAKCKKDTRGSRPRFPQDPPVHASGNGGGAAAAAPAQVGSSSGDAAGGGGAGGGDGTCAVVTLPRSGTHDTSVVNTTERSPAISSGGGAVLAAPSSSALHQLFSSPDPAAAHRLGGGGSGGGGLGFDTFGMTEEDMRDAAKARQQHNQQSNRQRTKRPAYGAKRPAYGAAQSRAMACRCKNSKCLMLYCICFAGGVECDAQRCACADCLNVAGTPARDEAIEKVLKSKGAAFFSHDCQHPSVKRLRAAEPVPVPKSVREVLDEQMWQHSLRAWCVRTA